MPLHSQAGLRLNIPLKRVEFLQFSNYWCWPTISSDCEEYFVWTEVCQVARYEGEEGGAGLVTEVLSGSGGSAV